MTYVVVENCIKCKYMDCVEVCPVDCFYEGENMLVIHPDECIDCGVCEPECPARGHQAGHRGGTREMAGVERQVRKDLGEYYCQKGALGRRQGLGRGAGQVQEVLFAAVWNRGLNTPSSGTTFGIGFGCGSVWRLTHSLKSHDLRVEFPFYVGLRL